MRAEVYPVFELYGTAGVGPVGVGDAAYFEEYLTFLGVVGYLGQLAVVRPEVGHGVEVLHEVDDYILVVGHAGVEGLARHQFEPDAVVVFGVEGSHMYRYCHGVLIETFSEGLFLAERVLHAVLGILAFPGVGTHRVEAVVVVVDGALQADGDLQLVVARSHAEEVGVEGVALGIGAGVEFTLGEVEGGSLGVVEVDDVFAAGGAEAEGHKQVEVFFHVRVLLFIGLRSRSPVHTRAAAKYSWPCSFSRCFPCSSRRRWLARCGVCSRKTTVPRP